MQKRKEAVKKVQAEAARKREEEAKAKRVSKAAKPALKPKPKPAREGTPVGGLLNMAPRAPNVLGAEFALNPFSPAGLSPARQIAYNARYPMEAGAGQALRSYFNPSESAMREIGADVGDERFVPREGSAKLLDPEGLLANFLERTGQDVAPFARGGLLSPEFLSEYGPGGGSPWMYLPPGFTESSLMPTSFYNRELTSRHISDLLRGAPPEQLGGLLPRVEAYGQQVGFDPQTMPPEYQSARQTMGMGPQTPFGAYGPYLV